MDKFQCVYYSDSSFTYIYTKENANDKIMSNKGFQRWTRCKMAGTNEESELEEYAWYL